MAGTLTAMIAAAFSGVTPDPYYEYTTLLLPGNGTNGAQNNTFLDASTNNFTITRNGNTTQGTFSPFSQTGWSGSFNTSTTYLTVTDTSNLRFGSSNFTIEAFVYRAASGATQTIASKGASTPTGWVFQISSADKLVFTDTSTSITGATSLAANTWYYVAVVRAGTGSNQTTLYVNAASDATGTSATTFSQTDNMKIGADRSNTNFANGYISNLRLSNTNRTISSTPTSALAADSNTIFLGLYNNRFQYTDSTAAFTNMTVTGTPSVQAFSPFNPTSSWSATTNGGSGYFDGTGDWVNPNTTSANLALGSGDFTIEFWLNTSRGATRQYICDFRNNGSTGAISPLTAISIIWGDNGADAAGNWLRYLGLNNGSIAVSFDLLGVTLSSLSNQWNHIAIVRSSGTVYGYLNGVRKNSAADSTNYNVNCSVSVGSFNTGAINYLGNISDFRVVKGTAVYTGTTYTVPTAPLTAITNTSLLLNFTNAGIYDATSKNDLETVGNAQVSTAINNAFGANTGVMKFDGTGDWLTSVNNPAFNLGSGDFTVELWLYITTNQSANTIVSNRSGGSGTNTMWSLQFYGATNRIDWHTGTAIVLSASSTISTTTWTHVAVSRASGTIKMFFNGTQVATASDTRDYSYNGPTQVGYEAYGTAGYLNGYIQDLRITKGYARYTANFTPPTAAFPTL